MPVFGKIIRDVIYRKRRIAAENTGHSLLGAMSVRIIAGKKNALLLQSMETGRDIRHTADALHQIGGPALQNDKDNVGLFAGKYRNQRVLSAPVQLLHHRLGFFILHEMEQTVVHAAEIVKTAEQVVMWIDRRIVQHRMGGIIGRALRNGDCIKTAAHAHKA